MFESMCAASDVRAQHCIASAILGEKIDPIQSSLSTPSLEPYACWAKCPVEETVYHFDRHTHEGLDRIEAQNPAESRKEALA